MSSSTDIIRRLNDALRTGGECANGMILITAGVRDLGPEFIAKARHAVAAFDMFTEDNDPYGEHDFGALEVDGERLFFKLDYYDPEMKVHSADPADPNLTKRVLTILLASEY